jgi:hypothetical protein
VGVETGAGEANAVGVLFDSSRAGDACASRQHFVMSPNMKATTTKAATRFSADVSRNFSLSRFNLERQLFFNRRTLN